MQLRFGADVRPLDGTGLGSLERVLLEVETDQVTSLVVRQSGLMGSLKTVPIGSLDQSEPDEIYVDLSTEQFDDLPAFETAHNIAPPPDVENITEDQITDPVDVPDVAPVGAATGVESIAFTPIIQEDMDEPEGTVVLDRTTEVWATDQRVGHLQGVEMSDETRRITQLIVQGGIIFTHTDMVPYSAVQTMGGRIVLNVTAEAVHQAQDED